MKIVVLDITGRNAEQYNPALCNKLSQYTSNADIVLMAPTCYGSPHGFSYKKLCRFVPLSQTSSTSKAKRLLRALESFTNYVIVLFQLLFNKVTVLHIQWLVFVEYSSIEHLFLKLFKYVRPKLKIILTVHNVFPHDLSPRGREIYKKRFLKIGKCIDGYIVHLESAKEEFITSFGIEPSKVHVAYHGIYIADNYNHIDKPKNGLIEIVMFGKHTKYKGADILIEALQLMPDAYKKKVHASIIGTTDQELYAQYIGKAKSLGISWINRFVSDDELYSAIGQSDLILLPYRKISQSGALLLALSYRKPVLTSRLPSFVETMKGYPSDYFFEPDNPRALAEMIIAFVDGKIDHELMTKAIDGLNEIYSWDETAKRTIEAYGI